MSQIVVYFLHSTSVLSFYECSLDTFYLKPGFEISSLIDYLFGPQSFENKDLDIKWQLLPTTNVIAMIQGHPYWQNGKYGNSS